MLLVGQGAAQGRAEQGAHQVARRAVVLGQRVAPAVAPQAQRRHPVGHGEVRVLALGVDDHDAPRALERAVDHHLDHRALARADGARHDDVGVGDEARPVGVEGVEAEGAPALGPTEGASGEARAGVVGGQSQVARGRREVTQWVNDPLTTSPPGGGRASHGPWRPARARSAGPTRARRAGPSATRSSSSSRSLARTLTRIATRARARPWATSDSRWRRRSRERSRRAVRRNPARADAAPSLRTRCTARSARRRARAPPTTARRTERTTPGPAELEPLEGGAAPGHRGQVLDAHQREHALARAQVPPALQDRPGAARRGRVRRASASASLDQPGGGATLAG